MGELFSLMELLGTVAFAVSGAMVAIDRRTDIFGVVFLGMTTAIGGGMVRDCLLGNTPPAIFSNGITLATALLCPLVVFVVASIAGPAYHKHKLLVDSINNWVDALGLGAFSVTGVRVVISAGHGDKWFLAILMGMITGIGGGVLRDVMTNSTPFVLTKRVYALASIAGAAYYLFATQLGMDATIAGMSAVALVFCVRVLATVFRWNLPKIKV